MLKKIRRKKEDIDAKNNAENLVYQARKTVEDAKLEGADKENIEAKAKKLEEAIGANDIDKIKSLSEELTNEIYKVSEKMYKANEANAGTNGASNEDVVDADYEVIDEDEE